MSAPKVKRIDHTSGHVCAPRNGLTRQYRSNYSCTYQAQDGSGRRVMVFEYWREIGNSGEHEHRCLAFFPDRFSSQTDRAGLSSRFLWLDLSPAAVAKRLLRGDDCDPIARRLSQY